ncbi:MAG: D-alanine--D-alanine ligase [Flavobacteriaceae bacterium]|nr:D-alanine--D-alanine ligase [Flavobacteriaceae bacterium]
MKKNVAIIMGGHSSEVHISLKSGEMVYNNIDRNLFNPYRVHILNDKWVLVDENEEEFPINKHDFSATLNGRKVIFDVVFNAIHGTPGEDGTIIAYFKLLGIKHTSASFYLMALTFNKRDCLSVAKSYGVKTAVSYYLNKGETINKKEIIDKVGLPCFVKPNNAGSSFGISKVKEEHELYAAIEKAFTEDTEILIESFLDGTEVSVGVLEYKNEVIVLPMTEIVSENEFFDYEAKYLGKSQEITPARISKIQHENTEKIAKKLYLSLNMKGFTRSEFILIGDEPYFLEMNTVPGLTQESIFPQQAAKAGISKKELFTNAIEMALK